MEKSFIFGENPIRYVVEPPKLRERNLLTLSLDERKYSRLSRSNDILEFILLVRVVKLKTISDFFTKFLN